MTEDRKKNKTVGARWSMTRERETKRERDGEKDRRQTLTNRVGHSATSPPQPVLVLDKATTDPRQSSKGTTIHDVFLAVVDWRSMAWVSEGLYRLEARRIVERGAVKTLQDRLWRQECAMAFQINTRLRLVHVDRMTCLAMCSGVGGMKMNVDRRGETYVGQRQGGVYAPGWETVEG